MDAREERGMAKRKFGDAVMSKTDAAMVNEVLCKFVCHNLCCLILAQYELGIEAVFRPTGTTVALVPTV